jgi:hypothetical protein
MAPDMHLLGTDEVARNGAFRRILRPEVFPDAPLQSSVWLQYIGLVVKLHFARFPGPPPRVLPWNED